MIGPVAIFSEQRWHRPIHRRVSPPRRATPRFDLAQQAAQKRSCNVLVICPNGRGEQFLRRIVVADATDAADARLCAPTPAEAHQPFRV